MNTVLEVGVLDEGGTIDVIKFACHLCTLEAVARMPAREKQQWLALLDDTVEYPIAFLPRTQQAAIARLSRGDDTLYRVILGCQLYGGTVEEMVTWLVTAKLNELADLEELGEIDEHEVMVMMN